MASKNNLLGSGIPFEDEEQRPASKNVPAWLYHKDHAARIFNTEEELNIAKMNGWVTSPAFINKVQEYEKVVETLEIPSIVLPEPYKEAEPIEIKKKPGRPKRK